MDSTISRRQLLHGDISGRRTPIRPPWAIEESAFVEQCNECGDCITHCPIGAVERGSGNLPVINFSRNECLLCGDCATACTSGALKKHGDAPWTVKAFIDQKICLAHQGVECRSCQDPCEARAIQMPPQRGGISVPQLHTESCTGCGACFSVCPVSAISMQHTNPVETV